MTLSTSRTGLAKVAKFRRVLAGGIAVIRHGLVGLGLVARRTLSAPVIALVLDEWPDSGQP